MYLPNLQQIIIGEGCFNNLEDILSIENYPHLENIMVMKKSLIKISTLRICNNEQMRIIEIGDNAMCNVKNVSIESIRLINISYFYIFLIYNHSK